LQVIIYFIGLVQLIKTNTIPILDTNKIPEPSILPDSVSRSSSYSYSYNSKINLVIQLSNLLT